MTASHGSDRHFFARQFAAFIFSCLLASCAGSKAGQERQGENSHKALEDTSCPNASDFRGIGIGSNESEALAQARANMAQEHFSVKLKSDLSIRTQDIDGVASSRAKININQEAKLLNPNDAKLHHSARQGDKVGVVACMSKSDAAKGFAERGRLVADSLDLASHVLLNTSHPKRKNEAWNKTQTLWNEYARIQNLLDGWGAKPLAPKTEVIEKAADDYKNYCQNMKVYWEDAENECSDAVFARLSKKTSMEKSACSDGFKFRFACEEKCKSLSYGVECSFEPSLAVESCGGERYSLLRAAEPATGSDMNSKSKAMENLIGKLPQAAFFEQWEKEIKEWVPQCVD